MKIHFIVLLPLFCVGYLFAADLNNNTSTNSNIYTTPNRNSPPSENRELRSDQTLDASRNYSNPSYQGNIRPTDEEWHNSPNNQNYFDDPNWPNNVRRR